MTSPTGKAESTRGSQVPPHPEVQATGTRGRPDPCGEPRATPETTRTPAAEPAGRPWLFPHPPPPSPPRPAPRQPRPRPPARRGHRGHPPANGHPASCPAPPLRRLPTPPRVAPDPSRDARRPGDHFAPELKRRRLLAESPAASRLPGPRRPPPQSGVPRRARPLLPTGRVPEVTAHPGTGAQARTAPPPGPIEPIGVGLGRGLGGHAGLARAGGVERGWERAQVGRAVFDELVLLLLLNRNGNEADLYPTVATTKTEARTTAVWYFKPTPPAAGVVYQ